MDKPARPAEGAAAPPADRQFVAATEAQIGKWVFAAASLIAMLAWAVETYTGIIAPWDRWTVPMLAVLLAGAAWAIHARPERSVAPRVVGCVVLNVYLIGTAMMAFYAPSGPMGLHQLFTTQYWLPLGYATNFIFLPSRVALTVSLIGFAVMFVPATYSLHVSAEAAWAREIGPLIGVIAVAQVGYIVVLLAVATMRAAHHRDRERLRVTQRMVNTDLLTGLNSRRACDEILAASVREATEQGAPLCVMLADIDHFKRINDTHGHDAGDRALTDIGQVLAAQLRASDHVGRWGGEEFVVIAHRASVQSSLQLAERLRVAVAGFRFAHGEPVTISIGVAAHLPGDDVRLLLARADRALYRAKSEGRNRIVADQPVPDCEPA